MSRALLTIAAWAVFAAIPAVALAQADLRNYPGKEWPTIGGDWHNTRYSTLDQVNLDNIKNLKAAWMVHLGSGLGSKYSMEGTPIVQNGVMYFATGNDDVFALNAKTGERLWEHFSGIPQDNGAVCCGWDNRGVAVAEGKVFVGQLDGKLTALDAKTGKVVWQTVIGRWQDGYSITAAPLYYKGRVYTGISGANRRTRGKLTALDAKTGKEIWHFWTVPEPGDVGSDTWPAPNDPDPARADAYKHGGANVWQTPAVDTELGLLYFTTANAGPDATGHGAVRPGDNLFTSSMLALHLDGTYAWHFQMVHHDLWDFDCPSEVILFDQTYDGVLRKGVAEACKTGWIYILDRTNGKPLIGINETPVEQDWHSITSVSQPVPVGDAVVPQCPEPLGTWITKCIFGTYWDQPVLMTPTGNGGVNWSPMSYDPQTGYFYVTGAVRPGVRIAPETGKEAPLPMGAKYSGTLTAVDSRTNRIVWQHKMPYSIGQGSGSLTTAGGLLFHGEPSGNFQAYNAKTGDQLWQWQTGAGADAPAITYEIDGEQYLAIAAGGLAIQTSSANGDMIWAFKLNGNPNNPVPQAETPPPPPSELSFDSPRTLRAARIRDSDKVAMEDYRFFPPQIRIETGTKVTFTNRGATQHNATGGEGGGWDTGLLNTGQTATVTFNKPGKYPYGCTPHPSMMGQIVVVGPEISGAPPIVVEGSGIKAGGPMNMPEHSLH